MPFGYREHGTCFGERNIVLHSKDYEHTRCFISNCFSRYREEDRWDDVMIEKHVRREHVVRAGRES